MQNIERFEEVYRYIGDTLSKKTLSLYINKLKQENEQGYDKIYYKGYNHELTFYFKNGKLSRKTGPVIDIKTKVFHYSATWYSYQVWINNNKLITYSSAYLAYTKNTYDKLKDYSYNDEIPKYFESFEFKKIDDSKTKKYHRLISPANVTYHEDGVSEGWYINDNEYLYEEFCIMSKCLDFVNKMRRKMWEKRLEEYLYRDLAKMVVKYILL